MYDASIKLKISGTEIFFGPGVAQLLEAVKREESMKGACASMKMSYSKGWNIINRAERELHTELIVRQHGGKSGGKCCLTEAGENFLSRYRQMEEEVNFYVKKAFAEYFPELIVEESEN